MGRFDGRDEPTPLVAAPPIAESIPSCILFASSARTASTQAGSGAADRVDRLAPAVFVDDLRRDGVGIKACSESLEDTESTGEGRPDEGARDDPLLMLLPRGAMVADGICSPRRVGELLLEFELLLLLSVESGESARSSASGKEGEMGV